MSGFRQVLLSAVSVAVASFILIGAIPGKSETDANALTLAESMLDWVAERTGLHIFEPPDIRLVSAEWMAARLEPGNLAAMPEALYGRSTHTLYLLEDWSPLDIRDQSILLHELVHHLQSMNQIPVSCPAQYNGLAYEVQIVWLREHGISDPFDFLGISPAEIFVQSLCPDPWGSLTDFRTSPPFE